MDATPAAMQVADRLTRAFLKEHPEYQKIDRSRLLDNLARVYDEVLRGSYIAKTDEQLEQESQAPGIARNHYLDLINMTAHAADDSGPIKPA